MSKLLRLFSLILAVLMVLVVSGCSHGTTSSETEEPLSDVVDDVQSVGNSSDQDLTNDNTSGGTVDNKDSGAKTNKTWKEVLSSMPKALQGSTLKVASWNEIEQVKGAKEVVAKFQKITGVKVKWQVINYGEYTTKIAAMIAANQSPDIVRLHALDPADMSVLQPISVSKFNFNDSAWSDYIRDYYTINGKCYAVSVDNSLFHQPNCVFYNKELITKYSLDDPYTIWKSNPNNWTFDKFIDICRDFRDQTGSDFTPWSTQGLFDYANFNNTDFTKFDGSKFVNNLNDPTLLKSWQQTLKWIEEGVTTTGFWDHDGFNAGKVLFHTTGFIAARSTQAYFTPLKASGSLGVVPIPKINGQKYYVNFYEMEAYGIAKGSKNPSTVPYFLRFYLDGGNYNEQTFFTDKRALEVYKWILKQGNYCTQSAQFVITKDAGYDKDIVTTLKLSKPEQVATIFKSFNAVVDRAVSQTNEKLAKLK